MKHHWIGHVEPVPLAAGELESLVGATLARIDLAAGPFAAETLLT